MADWSPLKNALRDVVNSMRQKKRDFLMAQILGLEVIDAKILVIGDEIFGYDPKTKITTTGLSLVAMPLGIGHGEMLKVVKFKASRQAVAILFNDGVERRLSLPKVREIGLEIVIGVGRKDSVDDIDLDRLCRIVDDNLIKIIGEEK